ncbi:MAG: hypothetical protein HYZ83_05670 [Candidatus Omnitrophica bacterium]|nr:hypothetical protein [Candidatus Omnitrophota bacterium]
MGNKIKLNYIMKNNLYHAAKQYVEIIEKIEKTTDPKELEKLEEKRVDLHWKFIDVLKSQGIEFKDRDHAARIAIRIAHGEL